MYLCVLVFVGVIGFQWVIGSTEHPDKASELEGLELRRKVQHALSGIMMVAVFKGGFVTQTEAFCTLAAAGAFGYGLHALRVASVDFNRLLMQMFGGVLRPHEKVDCLPGAFYNVVGCAVSLLIGTQDVACMCCLMLALGDPAASLVGRLVGRRSRCRFPGGKSLEGSLAMFGVCLVVDLGYLGVAQPMLSPGDAWRWS